MAGFRVAHVLSKCNPLVILAVTFCLIKCSAQQKMGNPQILREYPKNPSFQHVADVKNSYRRGRQEDEGDDGDDEGGAGAGAQPVGLWNNGQGAIAALNQISSAAPQFVSSLTQLSTSINQGLNGTDTPNLPSLLVKGGAQIIQALQAIQQSNQVAHNAQRQQIAQGQTQMVPGSAGPGINQKPPLSYYEQQGGAGYLPPQYTPRPGQTYFFQNMEHRVPPSYGASPPALPPSRIPESQQIPDIPSFEEVQQKLQQQNAAQNAPESHPVPAPAAATGPVMEAPSWGSGPQEASPPPVYHPPAPPANSPPVYQSPAPPVYQPPASPIQHPSPQYAPMLTSPVHETGAVEVGQQILEPTPKPVRSPADLNSWVLRHPGGSAVSEFIRPQPLYETSLQNQYIPSVVNLHEEGPKIGPQSNPSDTRNGFINRAPYIPVKNGVVVDTPLITPSPLAPVKPVALSQQGVRRRRRSTTTTPTPQDAEYYEEGEIAPVDKVV